MGIRVEGGRVIEDETPPIAEFYEHAKKVGIGKFEPTVYLKLRSPGVRDFMSKEATEADKELYAPAWEKYQQGLTQAEEGTPLKQLPAYKTAFALELRAMRVETVEELAALDAAPEDYMEPMYRQAKLFCELVALDA